MSRGNWRAPSDLTARLLRCYGDLFPRRPHCACFEHVQNLAATSATSLRSAALPRRSVRSHNDPAAISGDLADFADRSEVAVLCDWGITDHNGAVDLVSCCVWVLQIWLQNVLIEIPYLTTLKLSDYNLALKLHLHRFCIQQSHSHHMNILWTGNTHAQIWYLTTLELPYEYFYPSNNL